MENQARNEHSDDVANRPEQCTITQFRNLMKVLPHRPATFFPEPVRGASRNLRPYRQGALFHADRSEADLPRLAPP